MFKEALRDMVGSVEGAIAGIVMGFDGIAIDAYARPDAPFDITTVGMEFSGILTQIRKAAELLDAGETREVAIRSDKITTLIRLLTPEYFVALAIRPDGNYGKGWFQPAGGSVVEKQGERSEKKERAKGGCIAEERCAGDASKRGFVGSR